MPWSDWVEYGAATRPPDRINLEFAVAGNSAYQQSGTSQFDAYYSPDNALQTRHGHQFSAPYNWQWWRDPKPPLLDTMTEGVDYGPNPDTGNYVEYEGGENTLDGWDMAAPYLSQAYANNTGSTMTWAAGVLAGTSYTLGDIGGWPGLGAVYATGNEASPWGGYLSTPADPGPVERLSMLADVTALSGLEAYVAVIAPQSPMVRLRLPRFRYWMLSEANPIPLRQRQRDDGLGSSTLRARGVTSRQRSIRQRSYY